MIVFVPFFEILIFKAVRGPTSEIATDYAETLFDGTGQNLTLLKSGHLCIIPGVPAVDEAWFPFLSSLN